MNNKEKIRSLFKAILFVISCIIVGWLLHTHIPKIIELKQDVSSREAAYNTVATKPISLYGDLNENQENNVQEIEIETEKLSDSKTRLVLAIFKLLGAITLAVLGPMFFFKFVVRKGDRG